MNVRADAGAARDRDRFRAVAVRLARSEHQIAALRRFLRHDVRSPLTVILGHAQMMAERLVPESRLPQSFEAMRRQSSKLNTAIDQFFAEDAGQEAVLWVACSAVDEASVRAALAGMCVFVGDPAECEWLRDPDEAFLAVTPSDVGAVRRAAEALLATHREGALG